MFPLKSLARKELSISTRPADGLAPPGARTSADIVMLRKALEWLRGNVAVVWNMSQAFYYVISSRPHYSKFSRCS